MQQIKGNFFALVGGLFFSLLVFAAAGCVKQEASKSATVEKPLPVSATEREVAYIRQARETGDFNLNSNAQAAVNRALEIDPQNYDARKLKASLLLTFHRFAEGLEFGKQLQKENPRDAFVFGVLTDANAELGNYKEAAEAVQSMMDTKPNLESYARAAQIRSLYGDSDGAIEAMRIAAQIADPQNKEAQSWCLTQLGNEFFKVGRFEEAERQHDAALKILPDFHLALAGKGNVRAALGDYETAVKLFTQTQARVPSVETVIALGNVYAVTGEAEKAAEQYKLAEFIEQSLGNLDQRRLALLWADQDIKLDEALAIAEREHAARKDIYTADIYAWCLYKKGDFQQARKLVGEVMRLKTKNALFFYHAGMIEKSLGDKKAARDFLQKALQTNPSFDLLQAEKAKTALAELQ